MSDKCVLIIGAGGTKPYGLPLGRELRDSILRIAPDEPIIEALLKECRISKQAFVEFQKDFRSSGRASIDAFLEVRPQRLKPGKFAIAHCLTALESTPRLFPPYAPRDHWFEALWHKLEKSTWKEIQKTKLRIITFNYDRCLEFYLATIISNNYSVTYKRVLKWISDKIIVHVHGTLGDYELIKLDWKDERGIVTVVDGIPNAIKSIVVVSEANPKTEAFNRAREWISKADSIGFIGFGFHGENMKRLGITPRRGSWAGSANITCTHKGLTKMAWAQICITYFQPGYMDNSHKATSITQLVNEFVRAY